MCGIVGIWNQADEAIVAKMARSVAHRGPDGLSWMTKDNSSLGASRLAIMGDPDFSAIFHDPETDITVMLNGEIYNVGVLRAELAAAGTVFHTKLESEVVAKLYAHHGLGFAERLKGMFAVAILDDNQLVLARDRFGIKPLYYASVGHKVLFGSEIKAILAHPEVTARICLPALQEIAVFGYIFSLDKTLFQGITQLEPGMVTVFSKEGQTTAKFWQAPKASYFDEQCHPDYSAAIMRLRQLVIEAVDLLLSHGNDPTGIYLSGGLDSTTLALVARAILGHPITTFTLADGSDNPDLLAAREVARKLDTHHIERHVTLEHCVSKLRHFVTHYESLVAGGVFDIYGGLAFHLLSEIVSEHVRVGMSGEGADELFGGYYWVYTHPLGFADRIRNRLQAYPNGEEARNLVNDLFPFPEDERGYRRNVFDALMQGGLANYHLQSVDRSAGAFGFEVRPAYLYDDLASFAMSLPIEYKVPNQRITKRILRDAFRPEFERLGLQWVLTRPKEGMPAAIQSLASLISQRMEAAIDDLAFSRHPLRSYLSTKADMYLFDLFADTFFSKDDHAVYHRDPQ